MRPHLAGELRARVPCALQARARLEAHEPRTMEYRDYYKILGVTRAATADEVKKSYRRLARKFHPDVSKEKDAEARFKEVQEAYEVLKDPEKRAAYDQMGSYQPGQDFSPPPGWDQQFRSGEFGGFQDMSEVDLFDLLSGMRGG